MVRVAHIALVDNSSWLQTTSAAGNAIAIKVRKVIVAAFFWIIWAHRNNGCLMGLLRRKRRLLERFNLWLLSGLGVALNLVDFFPGRCGFVIPFSSYSLVFVINSFSCRPKKSNGSTTPSLPIFSKPS